MKNSLSILAAFFIYAMANGQTTSHLEIVKSIDVNNYGVTNLDVYFNDTHQLIAYSNNSGSATGDTLVIYDFKNDAVLSKILGVNWDFNIQFVNENQLLYRNNNALYKVENFNNPVITELLPAQTVSRFILSPDKTKLIAIQTIDDKLQIFNYNPTGNLTLVKTFDASDFGHPNGGETLAISSGNNFIASSGGYEENYVHLINLSTDEVTKINTSPRDGAYSPTFFDQNNELKLVVGGGWTGGSLEIIDVATKALVNSIPKFPHYNYTIAVDQTERYLVCGGYDGEMRLINIGNLTFTDLDSAPIYHINKVKFSQDNQYVISGSGAGGYAKLVIQKVIYHYQDQTITFEPISQKVATDVPFDLVASASSGLPITFTSSNPSVATVSGQRVTIVAAGSTIITAKQAGDGIYHPASDAIQTLTIIKASQAISFSTLEAKVLGNTPFNLTATASSGLPVQYSSLSDRVNISGNLVTPIKAGGVMITAAQSGDTRYAAAANIDQIFCIDPAKPAISKDGAGTESSVMVSSSNEGNQWFLNGVAIEGAIHRTFLAEEPGTYKVQVTVDNCVSKFSEAAVLVITGTEKVLDLGIRAYPNPAENYLELAGVNGNIGTSQLIDVTGRIRTIQFEKSGDIWRANIQHLTHGNYVLRVQVKNAVQEIRFIKK
jgi:hypothetical protein